MGDGDGRTGVAASERAGDAEKRGNVRYAGSGGPAAGKRGYKLVCADGKRRYKLYKLLGEGAFARVYLAEDLSGRLYACKVSPRGELLAREAGFQKVSACHPLFPAFYDFWREEDGGGCLLMEYVPGENLESVLKREGALSCRRAAEIGYHLAEGLEYLHHRREPLVFRDVKPSNVMLMPEGGVKLLDFGCACSPGICADRAGTPGFGAPEQFEQDRELTSAADVYGLGRTLQRTAGVNCRGLLKKITDRCTDKRQEERLGDMREVKELLRLCAVEEKARMSDRQSAVLKGEIRTLKDICIK